MMIVIVVATAGRRYHTYETSKPVLAFSFDYQECLASSAYQDKYLHLLSLLKQSEKKAELLTWQTTLFAYYNLPIMGFLNQTINQTINCAKLTKVPIIFFNGSNRQFAKTITMETSSAEYFKDAPLPIALEALQNLCCFMQTMLGENHPSTIVLDHLLLGDIYKKWEHGTTWTLAKEMIKSNTGNLANIPLEKRYMDRSKFDIIYAQLHKLALAYKETGRAYDIQFYFFDNTKSILNTMKYFLQDNPDLLPSNTSLSLMHYDGKEVVKLAVIKGTGHIDTHYQDSIWYTYNQFGKTIGEAKLDKLLLLSTEKNLLQFKAYRSNRMTTFTFTEQFTQIMDRFRLSKRS